MDVKEEILDYIKCNETTGALLLTGRWGCGKSYLAKQIATELNKEKKATAAIISLFGLDSVISINNRVKYEYSYLKLGPMKKKVKKLSKHFFSLLKEGLKVAAIASPKTTGLSAAAHGLSAALNYDLFSFVEVQNTIKSRNSESKFVVIFDDLERCGISNKKDLLGAINDFVENKQIKIIIIADEEKIKEEDYNEYKEKLISRTISMSTDYESVIESIVSNYIEVNEGYKIFLTENLDLLKNVFFESETFNIRTLKCIITDFERVHKAWNESGVSTENMKWVLYTYGADVFISKSPKKEENENSNQDLSFFPAEKKQYSDIGKNQSSFNSLLKWIREGSWDKEQFVDELNRKYGITNESPLFRFLTYYILDLQQNDIDEGLPEAVSRAYDGALSKDELAKVIGTIHWLKENSISLPVEVDYQKIKDGLEKRLERIQKGEINEPHSYIRIEESKVDEAAKPLIQILDGFDNKISAIKNKQLFLQYLSGDESMMQYMLKNLRLEEFDEHLLDEFTKRYDLLNNQKKREILETLLHFDFLEYATPKNIEHTTENFEKLAKFLEKHDNSDSITKLNNKHFADKILKKNEQLQNKLLEEKSCLN